MKYEDFKKMSRKEKRQYLKEGGKLEMNFTQKFWVVGRMVAVTFFIAWAGYHLATAPKSPEAQRRELAEHLVAECEVNVATYLQVPDSIKRDRAQTVTRETVKQYETEFVFTAKNAFGVPMQNRAKCTFTKLNDDQALRAIYINGKKV